MFPIYSNPIAFRSARAEGVTKYLPGLLLGIVVLSTVALADVMVPSVFTQEFARALAKAMPSASVKVTAICK